MSLWKSTLIALATLVGFFGVVLGAMALGGTAIHALDPTRRFDVFYVPHVAPVDFALLAVTVVWLFVPHPWAKKVVQPSEPREGSDGASNANADRGPQVLASSSTWARAPPVAQCH